MGKKDKKNKEKNYQKGESVKIDNNSTTNKKLGLVKYFVPMFIAGTYVVGESFYQGLLSGQGFSSGHFPINIDEKYLMAFYALVIYLFSTVEPLNGFWQSVFDVDWQSVATLLTISIAIQILVRFIFYLKKTKPLVNKNTTPQVSKGLKSVVQKLILEPLITLGIMYAMLIFTLLVLVLTIYLVGVINLPWSVGLEKGLKLTEEFQKNKCSYSKETKWNKCIEIIDVSGKVLHKGKLVVRNQNTIGLLDEKDGRALVYQLKDDDLIVRYSNHNQQPNQ